MALKGEFGPELKRQVEEGEICDWEIYYKLSDRQQMEAATKADRQWFEDQLDRADYLRKAERESFHE